jgi:Bacterial PH domain
MANKFTIESREYLVWKGEPSQVINLKFFALYGFGLLITLPLIFSHPFFGLIGTAILGFLIFDKFVEARDTKYALTHERMKIVKGGLLTGRQIYEIEIADLKDVKSNESFIDQIFGVGTIVLVFLGDPHLGTYRDLFEKKIHIMEGLAEPEKSLELIRAGIKKTDNRDTLERDNQFSFDFNKEKKNNQKLLK